MWSNLLLVQCPPLTLFTAFGVIFSGEGELMKGLITLCPLGRLDVFQAWYHVSFLICRLEQVPATLLGQRIRFFLVDSLPHWKQTYWTNCPLLYSLFDQTMPCSKWISGKRLCKSLTQAICQKWYVAMEMCSVPPPPGEIIGKWWVPQGKTVSSVLFMLRIWFCAQYVLSKCSQDHKILSRCSMTRSLGCQGQ